MRGAAPVRATSSMQSAAFCQRCILLPQNPMRILLSDEPRLREREVLGLQERIAKQERLASISTLSCAYVRTTGAKLTRAAMRKLKP